MKYSIILADPAWEYADRRAVRKDGKEERKWRDDLSSMWSRYDFL